MPNPDKRFPENEIAFRDRQGKEQRGTVVELLGQPDRGVETLQDAIAVAWHAMCQDLARNQENPEGSEK